MIMIHLFQQFLQWKEIINNSFTWFIYEQLRKWWKYQISIVDHSVRASLSYSFSLLHPYHFPRLLLGKENNLFVNLFSHSIIIIQLCVNILPGTQGQDEIMNTSYYRWMCWALWLILLPQILRKQQNRWNVEGKKHNFYESRTFTNPMGQTVKHTHKLLPSLDSSLLEKPGASLPKLQSRDAPATSLRSQLQNARRCGDSGTSPLRPTSISQAVEGETAVVTSHFHCLPAERACQR